MPPTPRPRPFVPCVGPFITDLYPGVGSKRGSPEHDGTKPNPYEFVKGINGGAFSTPAGQQGMHLDFGNNTIMPPARNTLQWAPLDEVQGIMYYDHYEDVGGPTAFVPGITHTTDPRYDPTDQTDSATMEERMDAL